MLVVNMASFIVSLNVYNTVCSESLLKIRGIVSAERYWKPDGTMASTYLVKQIYVSSEGCIPFLRFLQSDNYVIYRAPGRKMPVRRKLCCIFGTGTSKRIAKRSSRRQEQLPHPSSRTCKKFQGMRRKPTHPSHGTIATGLCHGLIGNFFFIGI